MDIIALWQNWSPVILPEDFYVLLAHTTKKEKTFLLAHPEYELSPEEGKMVERYLERRQKHEPVAYIIGHKEFYKRDFAVTPATLIPRPETEHLIETALNIIAKFHSSTERPVSENIDIIDMGTGSGNIIVTLASELASSSQHIQFFGTDISSEALAVASRNADTHQVSEKIHFIESDLLSHVPLPKNKNSHAIILANLPYLSQVIYKASPKDVHDYEPESALESGPDGLDHYRRLLQELTKRKGCYQSLFMLFEISPEQTRTILEEIRRAFPQATILVHQDLSSRDRLIESIIKP